MFFEECLVTAEPYYFVLLCLPAYDQYMGMKIDSNKLVMGVPWYGYDYQCLNLSQVKKIF